MLAFVLATALSLAAIEVHDRGLGNAFSIARWELTTVPNKWLHHLGAPLRDDPSADEAIARYFALDDRQSAEAERLENVVEAAIEGRIDAAARALGLDDPPGPFPGMLLGPLAVAPPVDIELAASPRVLVRSSRADIQRLGDELLRPDLGLSTVVALEEAVESADERVSALVVPTGGIATYPAIVAPQETYAATLTVAAHEWMHHYLVGYPLGRAYFASPDARTINETIADIAGMELASEALARFGDPSVDTTREVGAAAGEGPSALPVDRFGLLHSLRVEVEELLAADEVLEAERRMEEVREELAAAGVEIRRLNQAYFAWYGTYATRPDAVDPLGSQLRALRERSGDLEDFLRFVRHLTTREAIERAAGPAEHVALR